jgi:hypothetical protein
MTAQEREVLYYNYKTYWLSTEPLKPLFNLMGDDKPVLESGSTFCWRGYVGKWEIDNDKLFLIDFYGHTTDYVEVSMDFIFQYQKKAFTGWFTGEIKIPQGKMLHYEHLGYSSIFERDLFLEFNKAALVGSREIDNTKTLNPDDPYGTKDWIIDLP